MPSYNCKACNFSSNLKSNYARHLLTPKHKKRIIDSYTLRDESQKKEYFSLLIAHKCSQNLDLDAEIAQNLEKTKVKKTGVNSYYICEYCEKSFSRSSNLRRHQELYCKQMKEEKKSQKQDDIKELLEKTIIQQSKDIQDINKILKTVPTLKEINNLTHQNTHNVSNHNITNNHIVHNTINNISNTINNTININNFGNENLNMLTNKFMCSMIDKPYTAIPKMIKKIHFNDKYPENRNIRMVNKKDNKLQIIENGKWIYVDKDETLEMLLGDQNYHLDDYYEKNKSKFTDAQIHRFNRFQEKIGESDKKVNQNIVKGTDLIFWNNM